MRIEPINDEQVVIEDYLPRQSLLYRQDAWKTKLIAANVTQLLIVLAAVPSPSEMLLQRALLAAEAADIGAVIVLNKADLPETASWREKLGFYETLGYPVCEVSALENAEALRPVLQGHANIFLGQSGMGKSTSPMPFWAIRLRAWATFPPRSIPAATPPPTRNCMT